MNWKKKVSLSNFDVHNNRKDAIEFSNSAINVQNNISSIQIISSNQLSAQTKPSGLYLEKVNSTHQRLFIGNTIKFHLHVNLKGTFNL